MKLYAKLTRSNQTLIIRKHTPRLLILQTERHIVEEILVTIDALTHGGAGIGRTNEGKAVFIDATAPGDTVRAQVKADKGSYLIADLIAVEEQGSEREHPTCPFAQACGGCHWQHVSYGAQLAAKRDAVVSSLTRIGKTDPHQAEELVASCAPSKHTFGYRNKIELACSRDARGRLVLGFHSPASRDVVAVGLCPLGVRAIQGAPKALQGALRYLEGDADLGIFRVGVRHSPRTKSCEVALWTAPGPFPRAAAAKTIGSALRTSSIVRVIADTGSSRKVKNVEVLSGAGYWEETLGGYPYRVSAPSFFQVNTAQAETLQNIVLDGIEIRDGDVVADLYAGVGTFTLPIAEACGMCTAVESSGPAVRDLRRNAENAGVFVDVVGGDSARELEGLGRLDALVVDPPRAGLADGVAQSIAHAGPARLAYVSCDPATWARDVARLKDCGYVLKRATPVDLFPQTYHVEVASVFERS